MPDWSDSYLEDNVVAIIWCIFHQFHDGFVRCVSQVLLVTILSVGGSQELLNNTTEELKCISGR